MATPHVAGLAALIVSNGVTGHDNVKSVIENTADDLGSGGWDLTYGFGLINAAAALGGGSPPPPPPSENQPPVADAGADQSGEVGEAISFTGTGSSDSDGAVVSYEWDFGDSAIGIGATTTHTYSAEGVYTVTLTVTDDDAASDTDMSTITISTPPPPPGGEIEVFWDSFENGEWNNLWTEDSQRDWYDSAQRAVDGQYSAEVDGRANNAPLTSTPVDLQGMDEVTITFSWLIESGLDNGEYIAFDISTNGGNSWTELSRLRGNVDQENVWHESSLGANGISSLMLRFRGSMSGSGEDADVDAIRVMAR